MIALALAGCAARQHKEELSVAQHRSAAATERARGEAALERYDPYAAAPMTGILPGEPNAPYIGLGAWWGTFNPTDGAREEAVRYFAHAVEHEAQAQQLERFEAAECAAITPRLRAACPLVGPIAGLEDLPDGVRLHFAPDVALDELLALMRCHLAFARAQGQLRAPSCPLYVSGLQIERGPDGHSIDLTAKTRAVARQVQRLARDESRR